jgi:hypothetical protein
MRYEPAHAFLASINLAGLPNEPPAELLLRCHRMAKTYLSELPREYRAEKATAEAETNHNKFLCQQPKATHSCKTPISQGMPIVVAVI